MSPSPKLSRGPSPLQKSAFPTQSVPLRTYLGLFNMHRLYSLCIFHFRNITSTCLTRLTVAIHFIKELSPGNRQENHRQGALSKFPWIEFLFQMQTTPHPLQTQAAHSRGRKLTSPLLLALKPPLPLGEEKKKKPESLTLGEQQCLNAILNKQLCTQECWLLFHV